MWTNKTLVLYRMVPGHEDDAGNWVAGGWAPVRNIRVDFQPYSRELLLKQYGYDIDVTQRLFVADASDIAVGMQLRDGAQAYEVRQIVPWDTYSEVMIYAISKQSG